jgi:hypothetical protein
MTVEVKLHLENKFRSTLGRFILANIGNRKKKKRMANKTRRTEITIETHEITITRKGGNQRDAFCPGCKSTVTVFRHEEIAQLIQRSIGEVQDMLEKGDIHFINVSGESLVCGTSLGIKNSILKIKGEK